jgi:hypothetical protein
MLPLDLVRVIAGVCERLSLPYFVTGSLASTFYGEYRATHDVDVVVQLPSWQVKEFCTAFPEPDWYVSEDAAMQAARGPGMFNIIHVPTALKLDIIVLGGDRFDECRLSRARKVALPGGGQAIFSAPEDVILKKLAFFPRAGPTSTSATSPRCSVSPAIRSTVRTLIRGPCASACRRNGI